MTGSPAPSPRLSPGVVLHLSRLVVELRPEWNHRQVVAALQRHGDDPLVEVIHAVVMAALDASAETPFAMTNPLYRLPFTQSEQEYQREAAAARSREIRDRRVVDEARQQFRDYDPDGHRRGYHEAQRFMADLAARQPAHAAQARPEAES